MDSVRLTDVGYRYEDGTEALVNVNIAIEPGERVALIGPNGAGKSTLLHIMAALYLPTSGTVTIDGQEVTKKTAEKARRSVGLLFQDPDDQIFMPRVWDDVAFGPLNMGLDQNEVARRVEDAMLRAGVSSYAERVPHHLSFGEKKRVAIAGLLAMSPPVLLLDEPTANLDPQGRRDLMTVLDSLESTMVIATHDLTAAFEMADRALVLKRGVLYDGPIQRLVDSPDILAQANLELPSIPRLMSEWRKRRGLDFQLPLTMDEALEVLEEHHGDCRTSSSFRHEQANGTKP